jgi:hypothetical protein
LGKGSEQMPLPKLRKGALATWITKIQTATNGLWILTTTRFFQTRARTKSHYKQRAEQAEGENEILRKRLAELESK